MINWSRLEKRTCLSSTCYRPSMVSNVFPDQSFSPCHHREIICSYIQTPTAPAVPRRYSFYAECPSLPSTVGFSTTPFSDCTPSSPKSPSWLRPPTPRLFLIKVVRCRKTPQRQRRFNPGCPGITRHTRVLCACVSLKIYGIYFKMIYFKIYDKTTLLKLETKFYYIYNFICHKKKKHFKK